jgi:hypothetical protein
MSECSAAMILFCFAKQNIKRHPTFFNDCYKQFSPELEF